LDVKDRVGDVALAEYLLIFGVTLDRFARSGPAKKSLGIKYLI
jgi:hypothetical protein